MATVEITVTDLTFPPNLQDKYCKFRPVISLRYKDSNNKTAYAREALPGLGPRDYWECEKDNKKKDGYVRHDTQPKVDMETKLDISKREITFTDLDIKSFDRIEVEIFDIDILVKWEKILNTTISALEPQVLAFINPALPPSLTLIKAAVEKASGKKVADLEKGLLNKLTGRVDGAARSIWAHSQTLSTPPAEKVTIVGPGTQGNYSVSLNIVVS